MRRARVILLTSSLAVVLVFSGLLVAARQRDDGMYQALGVLAEVLHLVDAEYVEPLDTSSLELSLDGGLVQAIDPWAAVLPEGSVEPYRRLLGSPPAFGLGLAWRFSSAAVRFTLPGSPSADAGLQSWEVIELIDGVNTRGRPLWQIRLELAERERAGQEVHLAVVDRFVDERREVVLKPAPWQPEPVSVSDHQGVPVLEVHCLAKGAAAAIQKVAPATGPYVLDLRPLVWGFEDEAVKVADLFADRGQLASWSGQRVGEESFEATEGVVGSGLPVVLVNANTEGSGEILAAALQGLEAQIVGRRTAGHAPHMRLIHDGDLHLWIPVAYWQRADGSAIHGKGVEPGVELETTQADEDGDPALDRAVELAREQGGEAAATERSEAHGQAAA